MKKLRYWIATLADRLFPGRYCWADLVHWAEYGGRLCDAGRPRECRREAHTNEPYASCWCGKYKSQQCAANWAEYKQMLKKERFWEKTRK